MVNTYESLNFHFLFKTLPLHNTEDRKKPQDILLYFLNSLGMGREEKRYNLLQTFVY